MTLALLAAVVAAVVYGVTTVMQAVAARRSPGLAVLRQPLLVAALALDGAAWLLSLVALDRLPLFVVQAVLASSVVVVVLLARAVLAAPARPGDLLAVVAAVAAVAVLASGAGEQPATTPPAGFTVVTLGASGLLVAATAACYARGGPVVLGLLGGLGYSGAAVAARGAHAADGLVGTVLQPLALAILVCGACGVVASVRALERGAAGTIAAVVSVTEVVVPGAVGLLVLGDHVRPGWAVGCAAAVVVALAACWVLATSPAGRAVDEPGAAGAGA
jgi:drug/metabolite transporter (DMT)-like permease